MIDWRVVREITLIVLGAVTFGCVGCGLVLGAYFTGALMAPAVGYALCAIAFLVYEISAGYAFVRWLG